MADRVCDACGMDGAESNGFCRRCNNLGDEEFSFQYGTGANLVEPEEP